MKTVIRTSCEETELEWPDRRLFCLLLWDRWLRRRRLLKSGSRRAGAARKVPGWVRCLGVAIEAPGVWWKLRLKTG